MEGTFLGPVKLKFLIQSQMYPKTYTSLNLGEFISRSRYTKENLGPIQWEFLIQKD